MSAEGFVPPSDIPREKRLLGAAKMLGVQFEIKVAGLVALRAMNRNLNFQVFKNVSNLGVWDDLVVRLLEDDMTVFMQLKHSRPMNKSATVTKKRILSPEGDFAIKKYFESFEKIVKMRNIEESSTDLQRFIAEVIEGDYRFVLYTNMEVYGSNLEADGSAMPFEDLLATTRPGVRGVFSFTGQHQEVWGLVEGDRRKEYEDFLRRMRIFSCQSDIGELDEHLRAVVRRLYCGSVDVFLRRFLASLELWAQNPADDYCLAPSVLQPELPRCLAHELRCDAPKALNGTVLHFKVLKTLRRRLNSSKELRRPLRVVVPGAPDPGLRATKLLQILREEWREDSWTYVDGTALCRFTLDDLEDAARTALILVTDVEGEDKHLVSNLMTRLGKSVVEVALRTEAEGCDSVCDEWNLSQLSDEACEIALGKIVTFQGRSVVLKNLQEIWPQLPEQIHAETLLALDARQEVIIGSPLPAVEGVFERRLEHHSLVTKDALTQEAVTSGRGRLALSAFPQQLLENIARDLNLNDPKDNERWVFLTPADNTDQNALESLARRKRVKSLHHLEYVSGDSLEDLIMLWRYSIGDAEAMKDFVKVASKDCTKESVCKHNSSSAIISILELPTVLIVGEAGAGKTTQMEAMAAKLKELRPCQWVILVKILEHCHLLKSWQKEDLREEHVVKLLAAAAGATSEAARSSLKAALQCENGVSVFVDGVDEVAPAFTPKVLRLLSLLQQMIKGGTLWVASRPEVEGSLRRALRLPPVRLQPLTQDEQHRFLRTQWASEAPNPRTDVVEKMEERVKAARDWLAKEADGLLASALHLQMVAEIFSPYSTDTSQETSEKETFSLLHLYNLFVERKKQLYKNKYLPNVIFDNLSLEDDFQKRHQLCAVWFLLRDDASAKSLPMDEAERCVESLKHELGAKEKRGILWVDEHEVLHFLHYSFAEFFCAQWLFANARAAGGGRDFVLLGLPATGRLRTFLEEMLEEEWPLHAAAWRSDLWRLEELLVAGGSGAEIFARRDSFLEWSVAQYLELTFERESIGPLHAAACLGLLATMEALLGTTGGLNARTSFQRTPLHCAMGGCVWPYDSPHCHEAAQWLLRREGVDINAVDSEGWTPLSLAVAADCQLCIKTLQEAGASTECRRAEIPSFPMSVSCSDSFSHSGISNSEGGTHVATNDSLAPLHSVKNLIYPNNEELTGINQEYDLDIGSRREETRDSTERKGDTGRPTNNKINERGKMEGRNEELKWILEDRKMLMLEKERQLQLAISQTENLTSASALLQPGKMFITKNGSNSLPSKVSLAIGRKLLNSVREGNLVEVQTLLEAGAYVDITDSHGDSPLHLACCKGYVEVVEALLQAGADARRAGHRGWTPLHYAIWSNSAACVLLLLRCGAKANVRDRFGETPMHLAAYAADIPCQRLLLHYGADTRVANCEGKLPSDLARPGPMRELLDREIKSNK